MAASPANPANVFGKTLEMTNAFWSSAMMAHSAAVTIALRMPMFFEAATDPRAHSSRAETMRAATEKMDAAYESMAGANIAAFNMLMNMWRRPGDLSVVSSGLNAIAKAAEKPVAQRVHSNAKRLVKKATR